MKANTDLRIVKNSTQINNEAIGDLGGAALFQGLAEKPAMESLLLDGCGLGPEAGRALAQSLPSMVELTVLPLQQNNLDQAAAEAVYLTRCRAASSPCSAKFIRSLFSSHVAVFTFRTVLTVCLVTLSCISNLFDLWSC